MVAFVASLGMWLCAVVLLLSAMNLILSVSTARLTADEETEALDKAGRLIVVAVLMAVCSVWVAYAL